jgi:hypothetical protein
MNVIAVVLVELLLWAGRPALLPADAFRCADTIAVKTGGTSARKPFERISLLNTDGKEEFDLAPDESKQSGSSLTQSWKVSSYRALPLVMRCRYQGTEEVVDMPVPQGITLCTLQVTMDVKARIVGAGKMTCR